MRLWAPGSPCHAPSGVAPRRPRMTPCKRARMTPKMTPPTPRLSPPRRRLPPHRRPRCARPRPRARRRGSRTRSRPGCRARSTRMSSTGTRMSWPLFVTSMISSSCSTGKDATRLAVAAVDRHGGDALPAASGDPVLVGRGALAVAPLGHRQDELLLRAHLRVALGREARPRWAVSSSESAAPFSPFVCSPVTARRILR